MRFDWLGLVATLFFTTGLLGRLNPITLDKIIQCLGSKEARTEEAVELILRQPWMRKNGVTRGQARKLVVWIGKVYSKEIKKIKE